MNLLRRREMVQAGGPLPEWDYSWGYGDQVFLSADGWDKSTGNTGSSQETWSGSYYVLQANGGSGAYIQLERPDSYSRSTIFFSFRVNSSAARFDFCLSNGTTGVAIRCGYYSSNASLTGVFLMDSEKTKLKSFLNKKTYNLRLELNNGYADVYIRNYSDDEDWQLIASQVDCSTLSGDNSKTSIRFTSGYSTNQTGYVYSVRMRFKRI